MKLTLAFTLLVSTSNVYAFQSGVSSRIAHIRSTRRYAVAIEPPSAKIPLKPKSGDSHQIKSKEFATDMNGVALSVS